MLLFLNVDGLMFPLSDRLLPFDVDSVNHCKHNCGHRQTFSFESANLDTPMPTQRSRVSDFARTSPLVRDTQLGWSEQVRTVRVQLDQDKARVLVFIPALYAAWFRVRPMATALSPQPL